jgi:hypothetical protein
MSVFRVVYRQRQQDHQPSEDVEAVEFIQKEPWILFLDPAGTCLTIRSEDVERIERVQLTRPPDDPLPGPPADPPIP